MLLAEYFFLLTCWFIKNVELKPFHIAGGKVARKAQFPYFVQLKIQLSRSMVSFTCGGSLIHPQWVLSAGHCFKFEQLQLSTALRNDMIVAYMGTIVRYSQQHEAMNYIKEIYFHPNFYFESPNGMTVRKMRNDIAIGKLKDRYSLDYKIGTVYLSAPISDVKTWTKRCRNGTVMGIGKTERNKLAEKLLYARQSPKHLDDLKKFGLRPLPEDVAQRNTTFFTFAKLNQGHTMGGDSGGPFICYSGPNIAVQYGILSTGVERIKKGTKYDVSTFERVDVHLDFIRGIVPYINIHEPYCENH